MIDHIEGIVTRVGLDHCVLDAGGFGMRIHATPQTLAGLREGETGRVVTEFIVRQDQMVLFGFAGDDERTCFQALQTVTGVGARTALAVLAVHSPDDMRRAVAGEDLAALQRVPGIGKKSAERLVLELKDKILAAGVDPAAPRTGPAVGAGMDDAVLGQVREALEGLGWSSRQADTALVAVTAGPDAPQEVAAVLRAALRELGR